MKILCPCPPLLTECMKPLSHFVAVLEGKFKKACVQTSALPNNIVIMIIQIAYIAKY